VKQIVAILALSLVSATGFSAQKLNKADLLTAQKVITSNLTGIINWKVGQELHNKIGVMGLEGTMDIVVSDETQVGFWLTQDMSIAGQQMNSKALISKEDGTILELEVNGEKQTPPEAPEMEIQETKEETITVEAGTFKCLYANLKDLKTNEITEIWLNQKEIPINSAAKMITHQQGMEITSELVSFKM
jgi:hypothetical protein